ncbi:MAG TPA: hypothetical protein VMF53_17355 [Alphaproteobacteria bacterium]|nr:hypothetical protein [Alphaproteobacteria bacterium]
MLKNRRRPGWPGEPRLGDLIKRSEQVVWPTTWLEALRRGLAAAEIHGADVVTPDVIRLPVESRTHRTLPDEPVDRRQ